MTTKYDPNFQLEAFMNIGTAMCTEVTDHFATIEDSGPLTAYQLQSLYEGGWVQKFAPELRPHPVSCDITHTYTFFNEKGNGAFT